MKSWFMKDLQGLQVFPLELAELTRFVGLSRVHRLGKQLIVNGSLIKGLIPRSNNRNIKSWTSGCSAKRNKFPSIGSTKEMKGRMVDKYLLYAEFK